MPASLARWRSCWTVCCSSGRSCLCLACRGLAWRGLVGRVAPRAVAGLTSTWCRSLAAAAASPRSAARPTLGWDALLRLRALRARSTGSPAAGIMRPAPRLGPCRTRLLPCRLARAGRWRMVLTLWPMRWRIPATLRSRRARSRRSPGLPIAPAGCGACTRMRFALVRPRPTVARSESRMRLGGERRLGCCCDLRVAAMDTTPHKPEWRLTLAAKPAIGRCRHRPQAAQERPQLGLRPTGGAA